MKVDEASVVVEVALVVAVEEAEEKEELAPAGNRHQSLQARAVAMEGEGGQMI
jgi:hypothetical protein